MLMEIFTKYIKTISTVVAITVGIVTIYFYFHKECVILEVKAMSVQLLTESTSTDDLRVQYFYKDTIPVQNLWQIQYVIRNIGDATLIGTGENKQLLSENLPLTIKNQEHIYSIAITQSNNEASLLNNRICFKQWRSGEFVELIAFVESKEQPQLIISDRDIKDSEIIYQKYTPETINENAKIVDYLPRWLVQTIKILYFIFGGIIALGSIIAICQKGTWISKLSVIFVLLSLLIPLLWIF